MKYLLVLCVALFFSGCVNNRTIDRMLLGDKKSIKQYPSTIRDIKNPSEKLQLIAVTKDPDAIRHIKNPTLRVQEVAVKRKPYSIRYIKNPSEELKLEAVRKEGFSIIGIKDPTPQIQRIAARNIVAEGYYHGVSDVYEKLTDSRAKQILYPLYKKEKDYIESVKREQAREERRKALEKELERIRREQYYKTPQGKYERCVQECGFGYQTQFVNCSNNCWSKYLR